MLEYKSPADKNLEKRLSKIKGLSKLTSSKIGTEKAKVWFTFVC
jgi:hypothetical protein